MENIKTPFGTFRNVVSRADNFTEQLHESLRRLFRPQLESLGLTTQQISTQTLEELEASLETVNDAIEQADSFGVFRFELSADAGVVIVYSESKYHFEMGILPILLEAKKIILERLSEFRKQEQIDNLEQLVSRVADDSLRKKLSLELNNLNSQLALWRDKFEELEKQQRQEIDLQQASSTEQILQLTNTLESVRHERAIYKSLLGFLLGILGIFAILYLPYFLNWQWLLSHQKKTSIQVSLCLITLGLCWLIVDGSSNRRWFAFGSIVLAAFIGLLGLL